MVQEFGEQLVSLGKPHWIGGLALLVPEELGLELVRWWLLAGVEFERPREWYAWSY